MLGALGFLGSDIEQAHARRIMAMHDAGIGSTHDRELDEVARVAFTIRAEVEHDHVLILERGDQRSQRGPVDTAHGAQREFGHRHQGTGVARADGSAGGTALYRIDGEAHAGGLGAAQRLGRLLVTADHIVAMKYLGRPGQARMMLQCGLDARAVANQQELELVMTATRERGTFYHDAHALVAAHRVNGDTRQTHGDLQLNVGQRPTATTSRPL